MGAGRAERRNRPGSLIGGNMATDRLVNLLTDIRDHQLRQAENFERAIAEQKEYLALQRRSRHTFQFLVYAPWGLVAVLGLVLWLRLT